MGYRNYSVSNGFVVDKLGNGDFTTIQSAITAATSGDTIFIRPGTFTENLTLKVGVNLCAFEPALSYAADSATLPNVIINGTCTLTTAGTVGIEGVCLQTNSAAALAVTGSAASVVILTNCFLNCSNTTGITFSSSSASSGVELNYCSGDLATTGIALFSHSSAGNLRFLYSSFSNTGNSTTANAVSGTGGFFPNYSSWSNALTLSSSSTMNGNCLSLTMAGNQTALTTSSTATANISQSILSTGTSSAINAGSGTSVTLQSCNLSSSNVATVTGSGTLIYNTFSTNSTFAIGTSIIPDPFPGTDALRFIQSITASNSATVSFTQGFGQFSSFMVIFKEVQPVTNAATLGMQVSNNGGSSYSSTGYESGINTNAYNSATLSKCELHH